MAAAKTAAAQKREHGGHSHSHNGDENVYLTAANKNDAGVRITRIGLYVNLGMAITKAIGGYVFNSKALIADAIHSLTDLVSDVMTLATVSWAMRPPNEKFPVGYGKVESLGSLGVSGMLLGGGCLMGYAALVALGQQLIPGFSELAEQLGLLAHVHDHGHSHGDLGPSVHAAWIAGGSILIKEWLYRATMKVARERKSSILASNAVHHRVDSLTSLVALLIIGASNIFQNAAWLDPVGGLVISLMVIQAGSANIKSAVLELCDIGVDANMQARVHKAATAALAELGNMGKDTVYIRQVQGVKAGQTYRVEVELGVPGSWTVARTKRVEDAVRERVGAKVRGVKRVKVRFVALEGAQMGFSDEFIAADVSPRSSPEPEDEHEHGHSHHK